MCSKQASTLHLCLHVRINSSVMYISVFESVVVYISSHSEQLSSVVIQPVFVKLERTHVVTNTDLTIAMH
jgi:hypothetical protein